jgi:hypothetical protein
MHKGDWEKLEDLLAEMTEDEKGQVIRRVVDSLDGKRTVDEEADRARKQHLAWERLWKELQESPIPPPPDGLNASTNVDEIIYGNRDRH